MPAGGFGGLSIPFKGWQMDKDLREIFSDNDAIH